MSRTGYYLSHPEQQAIEGVLDGIPEQYSFVREIILFGSKARGDFHEESDIDLLLVTDLEVSWDVRFQIYDLLYEIELQHDVVISPVIVSHKAFAKNKASFLRRAREEGVILWSRE